MEFRYYLETLINLKKRQLQLIKSATFSNIIGPTIKPVGAFQDIDLNNIPLPFWVTGELARPGETFLGYMSGDELRKAYHDGKKRLSMMDQLPEKEKIRFNSTHNAYWDEPDNPQKFKDSKLVVGLVKNLLWDDTNEIFSYVGYLTDIHSARNVLGQVVNAVSMGFDYKIRWYEGKPHVVDIKVKEITISSNPHIVTSTIQPLMEKLVQV